MSDEIEKKIIRLEERTTTLEQQVLLALTKLADAVASVRIVTERLVNFETLFVKHDEEENEDRKKLTQTLDRLAESVRPLVEERRAVSVLADGIVKASVVVGAVIALVGLGPRVWTWLSNLIGG